MCIRDRCETGDVTVTCSWDVTVTCFCPLCEGVCEKHRMWLLPVFALSVRGSVRDTGCDCYLCLPSLWWGLRDMGCDCYLFLPSLWGGLCETWEATVWECTTPRSNIRMVGIRTRVKLISWEYQGHIKINTTAFKGHSDGNDSLTNGWKTMTHSNLGYHFCPNFRNSR